MRYISTRGDAAPASFSDVLMQALAPDGGLYLPETWPAPRDWSQLEDGSFSGVAAEVLSTFAGDDLSLEEARLLTKEAFATFRHEEVAPLRRLGTDHLLELWHGPTLAFKDVAMQVLSRLFERELSRRDQKLTVIVATSGDTGGAAVSALAGREGLRLCVLHPHERISSVQRRFMTTTGADNIINLAIEGTFDDAQTIVKELFADRPFAEAVSLGGVNSINWARIVAQVTYYITACRALGSDKPIHFAVPTGNFGDIFAGWGAKKLGAPIGRLIVAVNDNDILDRALREGAYIKEGVTATSSPSMDIEIASNFERALFEASGRDAELIKGLMKDLREKGGFHLPETVIATVREDFLSYRADQAQVKALMAEIASSEGQTIDPHTAVGVHAARSARQDGLEGDIVVLSTAHPAKFPDAVVDATGQKPGWPDLSEDLFALKESYEVIAAGIEIVKERLLRD